MGLVSTVRGDGQGMNRLMSWSLAARMDLRHWPRRPCPRQVSHGLLRDGAPSLLADSELSPTSPGGSFLSPPRTTWVGCGQRPRTRLVAVAKTLEPSHSRRDRGRRVGTPAWEIGSSSGTPLPRFSRSKNHPLTHLRPSPMRRQDAPLDTYRAGAMILFAQLDGVLNYHMSYHRIAHRQTRTNIRSMSEKWSSLRSMQVARARQHLLDKRCINSAARNAHLRLIHLDQLRITTLRSEQWTLLRRRRRDLHSSPACHPLRQQTLS